MASIALLGEEGELNDQISNIFVSFFLLLSHEVWLWTSSRIKATDLSLSVIRQTHPPLKKKEHKRRWRSFNNIISLYFVSLICGIVRTRSTLFAMDDSSTESSFALSSYVRGPVVRRQRSDSDDAHALQRHGDHATSTPPQNAAPKSDIQVESEDRPVADPEPGDVHGEPVADGGPPAGNSDEARTADHPATHHGDDLGFIAPKTMKIVLKGKPFHISVAPNDDVKLMAAKVYYVQCFHMLLSPITTKLWVCCSVYYRSKNKTRS